MDACVVGAHHQVVPHDYASTGAGGQGDLPPGSLTVLKIRNALFKRHQNDNTVKKQVHNFKLNRIRFLH